MMEIDSQDLIDQTIPVHINTSMTSNDLDIENNQDSEKTLVNEIKTTQKQSLTKEAMSNLKQTSTEFDFDVLKGKIEKSYKQIAISRKLRGFFRRRYQLFNKFDLGILMDNESWYSVTPEQIAHHTAMKCHQLLRENCKSTKPLTVLDAFCGAGGNTIQFAKYFDSVIANDCHFIKLQCAQNNANVYNVANKCNFIMQDFFQLHKTLDQTRAKIDLIFLSPPWGGVNYVQMRESDISEFPLDCFKIFLYCKKVLNCSSIVLFLPRNTNLEQILYMAGPGGQVEIEQNFLNQRLVAITAYYLNISN